jgi:PAS domain S-box-containing protein
MSRPNDSSLPTASNTVEQLKRRLRALEAELAELRESEQRWRSFAEATFEGILLHDGLRVVDVNPQFVELFGFKREWVIGRPILEFVATESKARVKEVLTAKSTEPYELVLYDARRRPVPVVIRPREMGENLRGVKNLRMAVIRTQRLQQM